MKSEVPKGVDTRYRGPACNLVEQRRWEAFLRHLLAFVDEHGSATPRSVHVTPDGFRLGYQAGFYRTARRQGHLHPEQIAVLDSLNGWKWQA